jgi:threonine/homoserine/homoserine lactone efflux protein
MTLETWLALLLRAPRQIRFVNRLFGGLFVGAAALLAGFKRAA